MSAELIEKSKVVLADTFTLYMKAHGYHWNVVGPDFPQLHKFFGDLYDELHDAVDDLAEHVRQLDSFAPGTVKRMAELTTLEEDDSIPTPQKMVSNLYDANEQVIQTLTEAYEMAEEEKMYGYSNFLQDRLTAHFKHRWMLKVTALRK
jgi:starvation-inducible DNA-binding protein